MMIVGLTMMMIVIAPIQSGDVITASHHYHQPSTVSDGTQRAVSRSASTFVGASRRPRRQTKTVVDVEEQRRSQQNIISDGGSPQSPQRAASRSASTSVGVSRRPRRQTQTVVDVEKQRRSQQNVTVDDDSVAAALAMAVGIAGRPPSRPVPPTPPAAKPAAKPVKNIASGGGSLNGKLSLGCEAEPCEHGGVCFTDVFSPRGFSCHCPEGYYGDVCEYGQYSRRILSHKHHHPAIFLLPLSLEDTFTPIGLQITNSSST